jgi:hypothetical protein
MKTMLAIRERVEINPPMFHGSGTLALGWDAVEAICRYVSCNSTTAETGAGVSTIGFACIGTKHLAVTPCKEEEVRIRQWLGQNGFSSDSIRFEDRFSWDSLPGLSAESLDLALIDGCHGIPVPFIDFFYFGRALKVDGILVIDDIQVWTGRVLQEFLKSETAWEHVETRGKTVFFRKVANVVGGEWEFDRQPFVLRQSRPSFAARLSVMIDLAKRGTKHLANADVEKLKKGFAYLFGKAK